MIRNISIAACGAALFLAAAAPAYASSLTQVQVSAVVSLLQSFGADSQTIANVETALNAGGTFPPPPPCKCPIIQAGGTSSCDCSGGGTTPPPIICNTDLSADISVGAKGSSVSSLQQSLGVSMTGYFGPLTQAAVIQWQSAHSLPATGYVGPLTRAALGRWCGGGTPPPLPPPPPTTFTASPTSGVAPLSVAFSANVSNAPSTYIISYGDGATSGPLQASSCATSGPCTIGIRHSYASNGTYTATLSPYIACMYSNPRCMIATQMLGSVVITVGGSQTAQSIVYSISPVSGAVGTVVSVTGFGFTSDNTILLDGNVAARNVPITSSIAIACTTDPKCHGGINQTLTFSVPSSIAPNCPSGSLCPTYMRLVTAGKYDISVANANGTSNTSSFTVTGTASQ